MHLRDGENILIKVKRHPTPYIVRVLGILLLAMPIYFIIYGVGTIISMDVMLILMAILSFLVGIIITIFSLNYFLDTLLISNKRIVLVNWKSIFQREENEVELVDIQDINTLEKGILSGLRILDYGSISIETAASKTSITFTNCPDPEKTKHFILVRIEAYKDSMRHDHEGYK